MRKHSRKYMVFHEMVHHLFQTGDSIFDRSKCRVSRLGVVYELGYEKRVVDKVLSDLEHSGYLIQSAAGSDSVITFTKKAKIEALLFKIEHCKTRLPGRRRVFVTFDIPLEKNSARKKWRRRLKGWGCKKLHASVWYTQKAVGPDLVRLIKLLRVSTYLKVIYGEEL